MTEKQSSVLEDDICFGLNRDRDEQSLTALLQLLSRPQAAALIIPRLSDEEIQQIVDQIMRLLGRHLTKQEYHTLFLIPPTPSNPTSATIQKDADLT